MALGTIAEELGARASDVHFQHSQVDTRVVFGYRTSSCAVRRGPARSCAVMRGGGLPGVAGTPRLTGTGSLAGNSSNAADLIFAAPSALAGLFVGLSNAAVPFKGGTLEPYPFFSPILLTTDASGGLALPFVMPTGVPVSTELRVQWTVQDGAAPVGVALSNAILGGTP